MRKWLLIVVGVLSALGLWAQNADDPVLLTVNGIPVTRSEFVYSYQHNCENGDAERISPADYLERFVDYKLKLAAALDAGYELPASAEQSVAAVPSVNVEDREACYRQACQAAGNTDMVCLAQILLKVDTRASAVGVEKVHQRMDSVYRALSQGADFSALAQRLSDDASAACGGNMGWVGPSQLLESVEREAYALQPGEMSRPFQTVAGWHVVKVLDRQPATSNVVRQWYLSSGPQQLQPVPSSGDEQLLHEYHEGLLVSRITQEAVYEQDAPEEKKLQRYFKKNKKRYGKKLKKRDYPQYRDLVLADYMQLQEQEWVVDLRHRYKVRTDKRVLRTIE